MRIAIIYATTEGQTLKLARRAAELCDAAGHEVELLDAVQVAPTLVMDPYQAAILLSSVHVSHYQAAMSTFLNDYKDELAAIPNAFVSVSLSAASSDADDVEGLREITDDFYKQTGFTPWIRTSCGRCIPVYEVRFLQALGHETDRAAKGA
jgi:menaquinone-dependent protoporphyrinogen oxidase